MNLLNSFGQTFFCVGTCILVIKWLKEEVVVMAAVVLKLFS